VCHNIFVVKTAQHITGGIVYKPFKVCRWIEAVWQAYKTMPPIRCIKVLS